METDFVPSTPIRGYHSSPRHNVLDHFLAKAEDETLNDAPATATMEFEEYDFAH